MPSFYTMFCYVTLGVPFGTLRKYCKYHASGRSGVFKGGLGALLVLLGVPRAVSGTSVVHLGVPRAVLGASLGSPRGLPGASLGPPGTPRGLSGDSLGYSR